MANFPDGGVPTHLVWLGVTLVLFLVATVLLYGTTGLHNDNPFWPVWVIGAVVATRVAVRLVPPRRAPAVAPLTWIFLGVLWAAGGFYLYHLFTGIDPHVLTRADYRCARNLERIGILLGEYAGAHGGRYPDRLGELLEDPNSTWWVYGAEIFVTPFSDDRPAPGPTTREAVAQLGTGGHLSYGYLGRGLTTACAAGTVIAYEPMSKHRGNIKGIHVLYADGSTAFFPEARARKVIAELEAGHNPPRLGR